MARPIKRNAEYFPHILPGKTMKYLRKKYGNDGYATWFILLEQLTDADDHHILCDEFQLTLLADECMVSCEVLTDIINDLATLGKFNAQLWTDKRVLYSENLRDSLEDAYRMRKNKCVETIDILAKYGLTASNSELTAKETPKKAQENTHSKVKQSKVKRNIHAKFVPPTLNQVIEFFQSKGHTEHFAKEVFDYYELGNWKDSQGNQVRNWKQKMKVNWLDKKNKPGQSQQDQPRPFVA